MKTILPKMLLEFKVIEQCKIKLNMPIFIDENFRVLFGNFLKSQLENEVECVIISKDYSIHLHPWLYELEKSLIEENNTQRLYRMENEISNLFKMKVSNEELININRPTETVDMIEFEKPANFKFKKKKKKENKDDNLFSRFGI